MPHLMNCLHSEAGWCLDCVKELYDESRKLEHILEWIERNQGSRLTLERDAAWDGTAMRKRIKATASVYKEGSYSSSVISRSEKGDEPIDMDDLYEAMIDAMNTVSAAAATMQASAAAMENRNR